ncbi:MAG: sodium:proton antiporter, partial [Anaerolineae bacterium]|nr:sodium:proton antiporter [Anaerolineae bacterium]
MGIASIIVLGVAANWLAWRFRLPSILLLLIFGFVIGPITGFLHPEELLGDLLFPLVSLSLAFILYEGGLSLRLSEFREVGGVVLKLILIGVIVTWFIAILGARLILGLSWPIAILLSAILVVTGPTVIIPLLQEVRPKSDVRSTLKWEGIFIDPVGAVLAVLVFEAIVAGELQQAPLLIAQGVLVTLVIGVVFGLLGAGLMIVLLKYFLVPDHLQNAMSMLLVVTTFTISDLLHPEAGLLTVTIMGVVLANQKLAPVKHIIEFKENLRVLLIAALFLLLAARLQLDDIRLLGWGALAFLAVLVLIARPAAVFISAWGSNLSLKERLFLSWMAPRGIVAAAVASIFSVRLLEIGDAEGALLVPLTFFVITGTVLLYGLTAKPVAYWLGVAEENPQGVLIMGAHALGRSMAEALRNEGIKTMLIDTDWRNLSEARMLDIPTHYGSAIAEFALDEIDFEGIGRFLALTSNDEANALAILHFAEMFGRSEVYQLPITKEQRGHERHRSALHLRGRTLFGETMTFPHLMEQFTNGAVVKATPLTQEFDYKDYQALHNGTAVPLFLVGADETLKIFTADNPP